MHVLVSNVNPCVVGVGILREIAFGAIAETFRSLFLLLPPSTNHRRDESLVSAICVCHLFSSGAGSFQSVRLICADGTFWDSFSPLAVFR